MTLRFVALCAALCVTTATVEANIGPLTCGTCREANLDVNFRKSLCYDIGGRYSALRQQMFVLSSKQKFEDITLILVEAYKNVHQCQTDVCAYTLLFQEKLPFNFANITDTEKMEILCKTSQHPFCRDYFHTNKRDTSSGVKDLMALVAGHAPECLQSMIDYHIREVLDHTHFTPSQIHTTKPTVKLTDAVTSATPTAKGTDAVTSATPTAKATDAVTSATPTAKATDAVTSATPTAKVTDAVTSATPTAKATDAVTSAIPTAKVTDAVTSATPTAKVTDAVTSATPTAKATDAVTSATPTAKATDAVTSATPTAKATDAVTSATPTAKVTDAVTSATSTSSETTTVAKITAKSLTCATCTDILSCTFKPTETTCDPGDLCMTTVTDTLSSKRSLVKGCRSVTWCGAKWWSQTSDVSTCLDVDTTVHDFDQTCMFCCDQDRCNAGHTLVPTHLYKPKD